MTADSFGFFIYTFTTIFVIIDPISGAMTFNSLTSNMAHEDENEIAEKAIALACLISLFFAISGSLILNLLSISVDSLRIAGGLLLFSIAFDMMYAKISEERITEEEISQSYKREDIWIFPIGLPLLAGPGTISTVIVLMGGAQTIEQKIIILITIILTFITCLFIFLFSRRINRLIGYNGTLVFSRLMGLLLAAFAIDMIVRGIMDMFKLTT